MQLSYFHENTQDGFWGLLGWSANAVLGVVVLLAGWSATPSSVQVVVGGSRRFPQSTRSLWGPHAPRIGVGCDVGETVGFSGGFATFEGFSPLLRTPGEACCSATCACCC
ncbi:MAG TPA: hypothetical protein VMY37_28425, partial [Thermoguttaceae bacterium]|nr:hypothetical protein [Thermoguttaceae bacterium]